ncbi:MAG TPA: hypothetical protein VHP11_04930 [Tepidisphaeraceae bacterium]|nr:hypothetical protein [Tepidisphaeraceae bacterium]
MRQWTKAALVLTAVTAVGAGLLHAAEDTVESRTRKLWPRQRIEAALQAVEQQRHDGLLSEDAYRRRKMAVGPVGQRDDPDGPTWRRIQHTPGSRHAAKHDAPP